MTCKKITLKELTKFLRKHKLWLENKPDGKRANLEWANLDYSCLPLWCGSLNAHFDDRQIKQIAYHLVKAGSNSKNTSEEVKAELVKIIDLANKFHEVDECGKITIPKNEVES